MKRNLLTYASLITCLACADEMPPQQQVSFTQGGGNSWNLDWTGVAGRTYFIQYSEDLVNWQYFPDMEHGETPPTYVVISSAEKYFVRLKYTDVPTSDPTGDDFDGDGIPNLFEVETVGSDPLDKSSAGGDADFDGAADGWEIFHYGNITAHDGDDDPDQDDLSNKEESELGLDPTQNQATNTSASSTRFNYDNAGRLTGVTAPLGSFSYTPDEEGNLLDAQ